MQSLEDWARISQDTDGSKMGRQESIHNQSPTWLERCEASSGQLAMLGWWQMTLTVILNTSVLVILLSLLRLNTKHSKL